MTLHSLFEERVREDRARVAVIWGEARLTYDALNRRANQVAHGLRGCGVTEGEPVGVFLSRSGEMVAGLLGILKAGGAYVPMDPTYPAERLQWILRDSQMRVVLTEGGLLPQLGTGPRAVVLAPGGEPFRGARDDDPGVAVSPAGLAYVLFTSGSTGRPKGVAIEHRSAVAFVRWAQRVFGPAELAGVLAGTSICFDLSVFELFVPLGSGGTVVLAGDALEVDRLPAKAEVTLINTVPSVAAELAAAGGVPAGVRTINLAGEALPAPLVEQLYATPGVERVYNLYGPTETTTYSTGALMRRGEPITIGRPITGTQVYIVDGHLQLVPMGVAGELYVAGAGVARGYWGRPGLTSERFVANPFAAEPGGRMYRTGDRARRLATGAIEYLGRTDHQVKIRGFRVELGDIEAALRRHPRVTDAVVTVREEGQERRLVAYVLARRSAGERDEAGDLRARAALPQELHTHLVQHLPPYMVPAAILELSAWPLTPNGKVDRQALPAPEYRPRSAYQAPRTAVEEMLAGIFAALLPAARAGIHDNFFRIGGHSLMAMRVISRARRAFNIALTVDALFERPTIAALAELIEARLVEGRSGGGRPAWFAPPARPASIPLSYEQQRLWFLDRLYGATPQYNMTALLPARGRPDRAALTRAVATLVERHEVLRTRFVEEDGEPVQVIDPAIDISVPVVDLRGLDGAARRARVFEEMLKARALPFDLARGPLLRVTLLQLDDDEHLLLRTIHHIVCDGWSEGILHRELHALYEAYRDGRPNPLPPLPVQYADFAIWQRTRLSGEAAAELLEYWRGQLAGVPPALELATARPRPPRQTFVGERSVVRLTPEQSAAVYRVRSEQQVTLYMTLLAAFAVLLARYTGQDDLVIGSPVANRPDPDLEGLIGFFVNTLVLRVRVQAHQSFAALLAEVRQTALDAYRHQDLPFERLVEDLAPPRRLDTPPVIQVLFALQNAPMQPQPPAAAAGTATRAYPRDGGHRFVRFDLEVYAGEHDGQIGLSCFYNRDLFDRGWIEQLLRHYVRVLESVAADSNGPVARIAMLDAEERRRALGVRDGTTEAGPAAATILEAIETQFAARPGALAVVSTDGDLTYAALHECTNRLARRLTERGVRRDEVIAVAIPRSPALVVAMLAVLESGAACLLLDPEEPAEQLGSMIAGTNPRHILATAETAAALPRARAALLVDSAEIISVGNGAPPDACERASIHPLQAAYVAYTSGHGGAAKGVVVPHCGLRNAIAAMHHALAVRPTDRVLAVSSAGSDMAMLEILGPLAAGATLVLASQDEVLYPAALAQSAVQQRATLFLGPPTLWRSIASELRRPIAGAKIVLARETLPADLPPRLEEVSGDIYNAYGVTEASMWSSCAKIGPAADGAPKLGRAFAHTNLYVLDGRLQPVPDGAAGEIYIGGRSVARGYVGAPRHTAAAFVVDPHGAPGSRMVRTGDLGRWAADGSLELLGRRAERRSDFRAADIARVESAVRACANVQDAAAIVASGEEGQAHLVAYAVPRPGRRLDADAVRQVLTRTLPAFLVPAAIVCLDSFPLTRHGTVDRPALRAASGAVRAQPGARAPRTDTEVAVLRVWADLLGRNDIGVQEDFFALGGHSLLVMRLIPRLADAFGITLAVEEVFNHPTIADLAATIEQRIIDEIERLPEGEAIRLALEPGAGGAA